MATTTSTTASSPTAVPDAPKPVQVAFSTEEVPIRAVTVFCEDKAEVTRVMGVSSPSSLGIHEVELTGLPGRRLVDQDSVRVKGSGYCTILHVSYSDQPKENTIPQLTDEEKEAAEAEKENIRQEIQRLSDKRAVITQESARNKRMRELADRYADGAVTSKLAGNANAAAALEVSDAHASSVADVGKALDWWSEKAAHTDAETRRLESEEKRLDDAIAKLRRGPTHIDARPKVHDPTKTRPGRVLVTIDVHELGPIDLEVKYMISGATWSPAYDLRVDTQTDSVSCTYFGRVAQSTTEDWEGVSLRLSTAEPTVRGTPPALATKTVSVKVENPLVHDGGYGAVRQASLSKHKKKHKGPAIQYATQMCETFDIETDRSRGGGGTPCAPPPPPQARPAVAGVEGGGGGIGAVSFVIAQPCIIKSNGQAKKLTVGVLQLSAEVTHYIVPSKEPAAYLQAKATNDTDYLLLASNDVSIFFDNSFVTKTSLTSVSPGESFQTFLGIDPAVKITVAPPRKTSKRRGIFSKSNYVTHTHSTSISNKKKVPVTCVVVDSIPLSTDEIIKVTLKQPPPLSVCESEAITDDVLASGALELFGENGGGVDDKSRSRSSSSSNITQPQPLSSTTTSYGVKGVAKTSCNHLAWVGRIAPQGDIHVPLEYVVEWPTGKEIETSERGGR